MNKYPPLQEPCLSCIYKCFRVEDEHFVADKTCRYSKENIKRFQREKIKEILGVQEELWKIK